VSRYLFFTGDKKLISQLEDVFSPREIRLKSPSDFPSLETKNKLVVIDGDTLPPKTSLSQLNGFKRKKIPVVYLFTDLSGKSVIEVLNSGVIAVLFKDYPAERIKGELKEILLNFNYLEKVKEITENDNRTKKFLGVVNTLTSDNDINTIMNNILGSTIEVFDLDSTVFFIVKKDRLTYKLELGQCPRDYSGAEWPLTLTDPHQEIKWLTDIQQSNNPIYITGKSKKAYMKYFPTNTLLLPLVIKEKFIGLIAAFFKPGVQQVSRREIDLLKAFADQTAVALENAKLYWDMIKANEKLIRQEKKDLLNQTIISLNHEINNPLSIISMEAQLLQQRREKNESKIESRIAKIEQNIERIKKILEKISSLNVDNLPLTEYIGGKKMLNLYEN
jgi:hypothetical protein